MLDFEVLKPLFCFLNVHMLLKHHSSDNVGWLMVECMHKKYNKKLKKIIVSFKYLALSCDEVITIDNQSWVSINCYVVQDWCCFFYSILESKLLKEKA